ncbi:hypothetical protein BBOV_III008070 [Babesia bovis T2Bo]|uniref:Uncharacterized protein n=1 Tax=Babesia bovis TaxID=5865 RepID=A7AP83_BABBO|nr:hypothetical protein BBOV_III008070 [Babesia bovis T2Bo]KAG6440055.1 hypothetical protein BBOV_III008070 [Babesia bovis T2Bo]|eukprot:XP_001611935.1 hypothetical protein [Babesia bovis T2Bo]
MIMTQEYRFSCLRWRRCDTAQNTKTSKITNKSHSRGTLVSKKPLVVVNQYEGDNIGTNELLAE